MNIAVVGDVHSNIESLRKAVELLEQSDCELVVFCGDILTYGPSPNEVVSLVLEVSKRYKTQICLGNHDSMYNDLLSNHRGYYDRLPDWIRDSVDWTVDSMDVGAWRELNFVDSFSINSVYFSHANPHGARDWSYINTDEEHRRALESLKEKSMIAGVFGHTHRQKVCLSTGANGLEFVDPSNITIGLEQSAVINAGSIGQPRGSMGASLLWINIAQSGGVELRYELFEYDKDKHLSELRLLPFQPDVINRLTGFFL